MPNHQWNRNGFFTGDCHKCGVNVEAAVPGDCDEGEPRIEAGVKP